jgi:hypothetical protein
MRTKGQGYVAINPNPKGGGWASAMGWAAKYYQQNQTQKNPNFDTIGKLVIQNYNADVGFGVFYNWDMKFALEDKGFYSFEFEHRGDKRRVYVLLHRERTHDGFYKVYLQDMKDMWKKDVYLAPNHIAKTQFYNFIESVIDDEYGLPF